MIWTFHTLLSLGCIRTRFEWEHWGADWGCIHVVLTAEVREWRMIPVRLSVEGDRATGSLRELRGAPSCSQMTLTGSGGPWATQLRLKDMLASMDMCWGSTEKWGRPKKEPAESGSQLFQQTTRQHTYFCSCYCVSGRWRWTHPPAECSPPQTKSGGFLIEQHIDRSPCQEAGPSQYCYVYKSDKSDLKGFLKIKQW